MKRLMDTIGVIGIILSGLWVMTIIFIDLPGWSGLIPLGLLVISALYSNRVEDKEAQE